MQRLRAGDEQWYQGADAFPGEESSPEWSAIRGTFDGTQDGNPYSESASSSRRSHIFDLDADMFTLPGVDDHLRVDGISGAVGFASREGSFIWVGTERGVYSISGEESNPHPEM